MKEIDKNILFVIPARSGSKGIKDKNIQKCGHDTLLRLSIRECLKLNLNGDIYVSTDCQRYINHIVDLIDNAPFLRPKNLSGDRIGDIEVLTHALIECQNFYKKNYSCIVMIQPTSPLRNVTHIEKAIELISLYDSDSLVSVTEIPHSMSPFSAMKLNKSGYLKPLKKTNENHKRSNKVKENQRKSWKNSDIHRKSTKNNENQKKIDENQRTS